MQNTKFNSQKIKSVCENKLSITFKGTKEFNGWFKYNNKKIARITVPKGRKFIPPKTYKSMANQLKLDVEKFDDLLDCPLKYEGYLKIINL